MTKVKDIIIQLIAGGNTNIIHALSKSGKLYALWIDEKDNSKYYWKSLCDSPELEIKKNGFCIFILFQVYMFLVTP